ncbi:MAG: hypothetical protein DI611_14905 [Brachybacterium faecium]|nr:MAG: hypothetical protein DI611_14905 [Brachybacterium faecium]
MQVEFFAGLDYRDEPIDATLKFADGIVGLASTKGLDLTVSRKPDPTHGRRQFMPDQSCNVNLL